MVDSSFTDQGNSLLVDPLPEDYLLCILMRLHFRLQLDVEDLQGLAS